MRDHHGKPAHAVVMVITHPAELDAIGHRLKRIGKDCTVVEVILRKRLDAPGSVCNRLTTRLAEDKSLLSGYASQVLDRIVELPVDQQAEQIARTLRPITLAVEPANLAIARLRALSGGN